MIPDAQDLVARAFAARAVARKAGARIVYVRVAFTDQDYVAIPPHNKGFAGVAVSRHLTDGMPPPGIHPGLQPEADDIVVTKTRFGAFSTCSVARFLNPHRIDTLLLAGVSTSGAVLSTLRDAADREYRLFAWPTAAQTLTPTCSGCWSSMSSRARPTSSTAPPCRRSWPDRHCGATASGKFHTSSGRFADHCATWLRNPDRSAGRRTQLKVCSMERWLGPPFAAAIGRTEQSVPAMKGRLS
jgi:nicotinamidase-related amidase